MSACLLLAGCVSVPTSGPVRLGEPVAGSDRGIERIVSSPGPGATPTAIVEGFLAANAQPADDYAVARSYLATTVKDEWKPEAGAIVYDDSATGSLLSGTGRDIVLNAPEAGSISNTDLFRSAEAGARLSREFTLRQESGEWRIDGVEPGLVLTRTDVERGYEGLDRYFLNAGNTALVPDRVLVPGDRPGIQTTLVRGLLKGPSAWLAPAVSTAFPSGTQLAIDSVPLVGATAIVDLSTQALSATDDQRRLMAAQLVWTLTSLESITSVKITVSGRPFTVPGVADVITREAFAGVNPDVLPAGTAGYVVVGKKLSQLTPSGPQPVPGTFGEGAVSSTSAAINLDASLAAVTVAAVGLAGSVFTAGLTADSSPEARTRVATVGSLSFTSGGDLWVVDSATGGVRVVPSSGRVRAVPVQGTGKVLSVRLARDGSRAAMVVRTTSGRTALYLARVVSGPQGRRLEAPRLVENEVSGVTDVAWADADTVVMIAKTSGVFEVVVGDLGTTTSGGVGGMTRVAAAPGSPILVEGDRGAGKRGVFENSGTGAWTPVVDDARAPAYPG